MADLKENAIRWLSSRHAPLLAFWTEGGLRPPEATLEAHCDIVYSLELMGRVNDIDSTAAKSFAELVAEREMPGFESRSSGKYVSVHNAAYVLGAMNLCLKQKDELYDIAFGRRKAHLDNIILRENGMPIFPLKWRHHNWRVSHWLGGIPSIILSLSRSASRHAGTFGSAFERCRAAVDTVIDKKTGLLHAYKSDALQSLFRIGYSLRHNAELGDVGGIAHILWIDHATDRRYVGLDSLYRQSSELFSRFSPFMERVPYCLDFDVVQIVRTTGEQMAVKSGDNAARARQMMGDIEEFFRHQPPETYTLHKLPGALATWHECGLVADSQGNYTDIIKKAYWL